MSHIQRRTIAGPGVAVQVTLDEIARCGDHFSGIERCIIRFALADPIATLTPESRSARLRRTLLGEHFPLPLANARLEGLRRVVVSLCRGTWDQSLQEMSRALLVGVSRSQLDRLLFLVTSGRVRTASERPFPRRRMVPC